MIKGVEVLWRRNEGCVAEIKGSGKVMSSGNSKGADFLAQHIYFATSMSSCGFCACERLGSNSMVSV